MYRRMWFVFGFYVFISLLCLCFWLGFGIVFSPFWMVFFFLFNAILPFFSILWMSPGPICVQQYDYRFCNQKFVIWLESTSIVSELVLTEHIHNRAPNHFTLFVFFPFECHFWFTYTTFCVMLHFDILKQLNTLKIKSLGHWNVFPFRRIVCRFMILDRISHVWEFE